MLVIFRILLSHFYVYNFSLICCTVLYFYVFYDCYVVKLASSGSVCRSAECLVNGDNTGDVVPPVTATRRPHVSISATDDNCVVVYDCVVKLTSSGSVCRSAECLVVNGDNTGDVVPAVITTRHPHVSISATDDNCVVVYDCVVKLTSSGSVCRSAECLVVNGDNTGDVVPPVITTRRPHVSISATDDNCVVVCDCVVKLASSGSVCRSAECLVNGDNTGDVVPPVTATRRPHISNFHSSRSLSTSLPDLVSPTDEFLGTCLSLLHFIINHHYVYYVQLFMLYI